MPRSRSIFTAFSTFLGHHSAARELRWMQHALSAGHCPNQASLSDMVLRRLRGEPLQYILGTQPFGPLDLLMRAPTLIPRPETEDWTTRLRSLLCPVPSNPLRALDLCTGTACIPLLLCHLLPAGSFHAIAVDVAEEAVRLARENATRCGVTLRNTCDPQLPTTNSIQVLHANLFDENFVTRLHQLGGSSFDLMTSNPPYIPRVEYDLLPSSVKDFEDPRALLGDPPEKSDGRGLTFYRKIAELVGDTSLVRMGGLVALEVGHDQSEEVQDIMMTQGRMSKTEVWKDPWDKDRVIIAWK